MKPFIPELNKPYFLICDGGEVCENIFRNKEHDIYRIKQGNCFPTLEAAEYHRRMQDKACQIRQHAFEPDRSDVEYRKWYAYFDRLYKKIGFNQEYWLTSAKIYFTDLETAREAFDGVSNNDFLYMQSRGLI